MSLLKVLPLRRQIIRCLSDIVESDKTAKFVVHKGRFIKAPIDSSHPAGSEVTHTGQYFEKNDPRNARFIGRKKLVNQNWAIDMIAKVPPIEVDGRIAVSDGSQGLESPALGHPRVYINLDNGKVKTCPYSGLRFVKKKKD